MGIRRRMITDSFIEIEYGKTIFRFSIDEFEVAQKLVSFIPLYNQVNRLKLVKGIREIFTLTLEEAIALLEAANENFYNAKR